jgi:ubiquitin-like-conjugating enzyme ATG10
MLISRLIDVKQVLRSHENRGPGSNGTGLPTYSIYPHQPYVTFEVHLHEIYRMPTLWFALHDLPMGEPPFDLDSVYRYLVPDEYKSGLRAVGVTGGISAAVSFINLYRCIAKTIHKPHPITDVPSFFIHPCRTKEAMENFDCPMAEYLMIWIGLIGGCVGLWVPRGMAEGATEGRENTIS